MDYTDDDEEDEQQAKRDKRNADRAQRKRAVRNTIERRELEKLTPQQREAAETAPYISRRDNRVRVGEAAATARRNERMGLPPPLGTAPPTPIHQQVPNWHPQSIAEMEAKIREAGIIGNQTGYLQMKSFVATANKTDSDKQTEIQRAALRQWRHPDWVPNELRNIHREEYMTQGRPWTGPSLNTPQVDEPAEKWAEWLYYKATDANSRPGIVHTQEGINLCSVQGMLLVSRRAPERRKGQPADASRT